MPIKVACSCGQNFAARDDMAGKTLKCPKCKQPLAIPRPANASRPASAAKRSAPAGKAQKAAAQARPQPAKQVSAARNDLADLFDEVGIAAAPAATGPPCPSCGKSLKPGALMCIECGFNLQTGQRMGTMAPQARGPATGHDPLSGQAEELVAKAAKEIAENPITGEGRDFGEGTNPLAWLLAICLPLLFCLAVFAVIQWGSGLGFFFGLVMGGFMTGNPLLITLAVLEFMCFVVVMVTWFKLTFAAMEDNVLLGLLCIVVLGIFPAIYGFIRYKKLLFWAIAYVASTILTILFFVGIFMIILADAALRG